MNERIQELAISSGIYDSLCDPYDSQNTGDAHGSVMDDLEKFAELIIKECAIICDDIGKEARKEWKTKYIPHDDGRCDGAWQCETAILEHFGVES
jgi:hypothetical protein